MKTVNTALIPADKIGLFQTKTLAIAPRLDALLFHIIKSLKRGSNNSFESPKTISTDRIEIVHWVK